jgi:alkylation response protein AidB-like acyl-CoA dehydrogenase
MTTVTVTVDAENATASSVLDNARALHEFIDSHAAQNDLAGSIAEPVIEQLYASGAMGAITPREFGGTEMTPRQAMELYRTLSYADPSAGWVTMAIAMVTGLAGAFLDRATAEELFATPRLGIAGQGTRAGEARPDGDDYLVSGSWQFASGIKHATHLHTAAADTETGETRFFLVPVGEVEFVDNWDVLGLRGTGSIDYSLDAKRVEARFSYPSLATEPVTGGWLYRVGIGNFASINHGAWALGVSRRLLDELALVTQRKAGRAGAQAGNASFLEQFAIAELRHRSAHALLFDVWEEIESVLQAGEPIPTRLSTLNRAALCNATESMAEVAEFVYRAAGTDALRSGTIQRLYRDVHGGTQHVSSSPIILQSAGQELAGLAEGKRWSHFSLV